MILLSLEWTAVATWKWLANDDNCGEFWNRFNYSVLMVNNGYYYPKLKIQLLIDLINDTSFRNLSNAVRFVLSRLPVARRWLSLSLGQMLPLLSHSLHREMDSSTAGTTAMSDVPANMELQRIESKGC